MVTAWESTFQWQRPYQSSHAQLKAEHQVELLPFEPVDCVCVLGHSQGLSSDTTQQKQTGRESGVSYVRAQVQHEPQTYSIESL